MNITVSQLPEDYIHPSGKPEGGYWGLFVDGELELTEQHKSDADLIADMMRAGQ